MGWGHFRRCYALAEVAQQSSRFRVHFLTRPLPKGLKKKVTEIHANSQILKEEATLEEDLSTLHSMFDMMTRKKIVVCVDHNQWTSECFDSLKSDNRVILMSFDDGLKRHYSSDYLVNPNLDADKIAYSAGDSCEKLLGPKYTMIREEVHTLRQHPTERMAENFQFLISLGAADKWGYAIRAIEAVRKSNVKFETHVVVNAEWPHLETAKRIIGNHPRVHLYEDPSFYPQLLARSDLALVAAGMTTYELAYLGVPMLTVALNPEQQTIGQAWASRGIAEHLGTAEILSVELVLDRLAYWMERDQELEDRGIKAQKIIDGRGKFRVLERVSKSLNFEQ
jgi:spore coat polysaccharide biosynthesis predicted glycosyltransferase SpsG